jgi:hypothetical protein
LTIDLKPWANSTSSEAKSGRTDGSPYVILAPRAAALLVRDWLSLDLAVSSQSMSKRDYIPFGLRDRRVCDSACEDAQGEVLGSCVWHLLKRAGYLKY